MTKIGHAAKQLQVRKGIWAMGMFRPPHSQTYANHGGNQKEDIVPSNILGLNVYQHGIIFRFFQNMVQPKAFLDISEGVNKKQQRLMSL